MSTATIALRTRPRPALGPALGRAPLPVGMILLSAVLHVIAVAALIAGIAIWHETQSKTYVVNLVPAIAAVGQPQGRVSAPAPTLPPRPSEVTPPATKATSTELPERAAPAPTPPPDMPARPSPRDSTSLPDRSMPPRAATLPRPGDKELPASAPARSSAENAAKREVSASPPPAPLGQIAGSSQGAGTVTLSVSDFPYAWYLQAVTRKIQERWEGRGIDGRQPEVIFAIGKDGQLRRLEVGKTSGNPAYDQLAMRAIRDATPFPNLPDGFEKPTLTIGLQFIYDPRGR